VEVRFSTPVQTGPGASPASYARGADKSLAQPGRKQARKNVREARDFNNIETRAVIKFFFPARQGAEGNSRHSDRNIFFFTSWSGKDLSAPLYSGYRVSPKGKAAREWH